MADSSTAPDTSTNGEGTPAPAAPAPVTADPQPVIAAKQPQPQIVAPLKKEDTPAATPDAKATPPVDDGKFEERYKELQGAFTKSRQEASELKERLARVEGAQSVQQQQSEQPPAATAPWDDETWMQTYSTLQDEDPGKAAVMFANAQADYTARMIVASEGIVSEQIMQRVAQVMNPERVELQDELDELSKVAGFEKLDLSAQLAVAKAVHAKTAAQEQAALTPPSSPAGTGTQPPADDAADVYMQKVQAQANAMGALPGTVKSGQVETTYTNHRS